MQSRFLLFCNQVCSYVNIVQFIQRYLKAFSGVGHAIMFSDLLSTRCSFLLKYCAFVLSHCIFESFRNIIYCTDTFFTAIFLFRVRGIVTVLFWSYYFVQGMEAVSSWNYVSYIVLYLNVMINFLISNVTLYVLVFINIITNYEFNCYSNFCLL